MFISEKKLRVSFEKIKAEMDDHLQAINENTNEIVSLYDYVEQLEEKITKLKEKIEDIEIKINDLSGIKTNFAKEIFLTPHEYEIFTLLYSKNDLMDYKEIARNLGITEFKAKKYIETMISKGVPIVKKYFENKIFLILDPDFVDLHAKNPIIKKSIVKK